jgi:hypothetical protein
LSSASVSSSITTTIVSSLARRVNSPIFSPKAARPPAKPRWPIGANLAWRTASSASARVLMWGICTPPAPRSRARVIVDSSLAWTRTIGVTFTSSAARTMFSTSSQPAGPCSQSMKMTSKPTRPSSSTSPAAV